MARMQIHVRQAFAPSAFGTAKADVTVLFDVFRASTTLAALLAAKPARVVATNDAAAAAELVAQGFQLVSEVFAGGIDNSPTQVVAARLGGRSVVHKSTNLTESLFRIFPEAQRVLIGSFANASTLVAALRAAAPARVELVAAGRHGGREECAEDTACAAFVRAALTGAMPAMPTLAALRPDLAKKRQAGEREAHYWADLDVALTRDAFATLPEARPADGELIEIVPAGSR
jgi:phosphosulfolactate phosphohydrolase-like enzyme